MNRKMKMLVAGAALATGCVFVACAGGMKVDDPSVFHNKNGVIGVFRQAAFYCDDKVPHTMTLGESRIVVKPGWSSEQDNLFVGEVKPGTAMLYSYEYSCGDNESKLSLDTTDNGKRAFPVAVKIPDQGFCKIVISFLENDNLFSHDDELLMEHFKKNKVALYYHEVPYCDVIDTKGNVVSFVNRDSLNNAMYAEAVRVAAGLKSDNIYPLVSLGAGSDMATLSGDNSQVVLVAWHNDPEAFKDGQNVTLKNQVLWAYSDKEFAKWFQENHEKVTNWNLRLRQLLGKSPYFDGNYFTVFWANVKDVYRPAYIPDPTSGLMNDAFEGPFEEDQSDEAMWFKNWFDETNAKATASEGGFPWTRLGYTYDWGRADGSKYGLSEFIVRDGAEVEVKFTRSTKAFLTWMKDRK